jgi:hypothetical protein
MNPQLLIFAVVIVLIWKLLSAIPMWIYICFIVVGGYFLSKKIYRDYQERQWLLRNTSTQTDIIPYNPSINVLDVEVERIEPKQRYNKSQNFSPEFPPNSSTYFVTTVAGITFRKVDAQIFFEGMDHSLEFERDPNNKHDKNAIKIIGISSGVRNFIGYVPKEFAEQLVLSKLDKIAKPYLQRIFCNSDDFYEVRFEVVGPSNLKQQFKDAYNKQPANSRQKDFYNFFKIPIPKKLTYEEAESLIKKEQARLLSGDAKSLDEFEAYLEIIEEFDTAYFRDDFEIKKPTKLQMEQALSELINQGYSYKDLSDNIDYVVDRLKLLNPQLDKS